MSYTYYNNLIKEMDSPIAANQPPPMTAGQKPYMDRFDQELTNAVNNGLEPDYVMKLTIFMCLIVERGLLPDVLKNRLNEILEYMKQHELQITDQYIENVIEHLNKKFL